MNESTIAVRYAKALFLLAQDKGILEQVKEDVLLISRALSENIQFGQYLDSPIVRPSQKKELVKQVFQGKLQEISYNFLGLLIQNKRESNIEAIFRRFLAVYREHMGIKTAIITSAIPLDKQTSNKLQQLIANTFKSEVELKINEDSGIIGGFILRVGDQQYDASVATGLKRIKSSLLTDSFK